MSKTVIQPLESMRFAQYAVPTLCYICGNNVVSDTDNTSSLPSASQAHVYIAKADTVDGNMYC